MKGLVSIFDIRPQTMTLSCAVFAFGLGILLYGWLTDVGLNARIAAYDSGVLLASIAHSKGTGLGMVRHSLTKVGPKIKSIILFLTFLSIISIIVIFTWLAFDGVINFGKTVTDNVNVRDVIHGVSAILCLASAIFYIRIYFKSRSGFYYWYSLGLILFAFGVLFISQGALESRIAWLGRASQYTSSIYFLVSVLVTNKQAEAQV